MDAENRTPPLDPYDKPAVRSFAMTEAAVKGAVLRSQIAALERLGWLDEVRAEVDPVTRKLFDTPPSLVDWIPVARSVAIVDAIARRRSLDDVVMFGTVGSARVIDTTLKPIIQGILSVFGVEPHRLFARSEIVLKAMFRGAVSRYVETGPSSGDFMLQIDVDGLSTAYWAMWRGTLAHAFPLCACEGTIGAPSLSESNTVARFDVRWNSSAQG
jgi:hypothetical protein